MGCCAKQGELHKVLHLPPVEDAGPGILQLIPGPYLIENPLTGKRDLEKWPYFKQIYLRGARLGYVNTKPGGAIFLLRHWDTEQLRVIHEAILEILHEAGYDIEQPRRCSKPSSPEGLLKKPREEGDEQIDAPRLIMPQ